MQVFLEVELSSFNEMKIIGDYQGGDLTVSIQLSGQVSLTVANKWLQQL
jgi:hypothetical protein